jgi:uncharacterized protein YfbU (UPF0304 family)
MAPPVKTERFEMRLDESVLERVDEWRARQADLPSRAESMRRLIDTALDTTRDTRIHFDNGSRLIAMMLCEIHKHMNIDTYNAEFIEAAIADGHLWALRWEYPMLFHGEEDNESEVREVAGILDLWRLVEDSYRRFAKKERDLIDDSIVEFNRPPQFRGFDGNYESTQYGITAFIIEKMGRYSEFKGRDLNSHMPMLDEYRPMVAALELIKRDGGLSILGRGLTPSQLIQVVNAARSPAELS